MKQNIYYLSAIHLNGQNIIFLSDEATINYELSGPVST